METMLDWCRIPKGVRDIRGFLINFQDQSETTNNEREQSSIKFTHTGKSLITHKQDGEIPIGDMLTGGGGRGGEVGGTP